MNSQPCAGGLAQEGITDVGRASGLHLETAAAVELYAGLDPAQKLQRFKVVGEGSMWAVSLANMRVHRATEF
jgi:hypothetical protein